MQSTFEQQINAVNYARKIMTSMEHDAVLNDAANTIRAASIYTEVAERKQARAEELEGILHSFKEQLNTIHTKPHTNEKFSKVWFTIAMLLSFLGVVFIIEHSINFLIN
jgi:hypothetical protein